MPLAHPFRASTILDAVSRIINVEANGIVFVDARLDTLETVLIIRDLTMMRLSANWKLFTVTCTLEVISIKR